MNLVTSGWHLSLLTREMVQESIATCVVWKEGVVMYSLVMRCVMATP